MNANLLTDLPAHLPDELFTTLLQAPEVQIERIVSHGHQSPDGFWYDQPTGEWVIVLKGAAKIELEGRTVEMGPGDYLDIPAHTKHRVAWTTPDEPTIWLAVHYKGEELASRTYFQSRKCVPDDVEETGRTFTPRNMSSPFPIEES